MSADLPVPQKVFGHGFILNRGQKESKSVGNVTDPLDLAETFGVDNLRYFLMREVAFGQDGSYSPQAIVTRCNAELANSFGNLVQRTLSMIAKNMDGAILDYEAAGEDKALLSKVQEACREALPREFEGLAFSVGIEAWMEAVWACNQYVDEQAPWALRKTDLKRMEAVLLTLYIAIRDLALAIQPVVPSKAKAVLDMLGVAEDRRGFSDLADESWYGALIAAGHRIGKPEPIFPRLELPETEAS